MAESYKEKRDRIRKEQKKRFLMNIDWIAERISGQYDLTSI